MEPILLLAMAWIIFGLFSLLVEMVAFREREGEPDRTKRMERIGALQLGGPISCVVVAWRALSSRWRDRVEGA